MRPMRIVLLAVLLVAVATGMPERGHYYVDIPWEDHTERGVYDLIGDSAFTVEYSAGIFDCSDMTAYFDWFLKSHGFHTYICIVETEYVCHSYLAVKVDIPNSSSQDIVYVETTTAIVQIVDRTHPEYESYQNESMHYDDIWLANVDLAESEIDWWANIKDIPVNSTLIIKLNSSLYPITETSFPSLI